MIRFSLGCDKGHAFEGWFRDNAEFERLKAAGLNACPACGSHAVEKALMTPAVQGAGKREPVALGMGDDQKKALAELKALTEKMRANSEDVGPRFAEEARKIHYGEAEARGIRGEATREEASALIEEGVPVMPLPSFPDEAN